VPEVDRTSALAEFLAATPVEAVPGHCLECARRCVLDTLGTAVYGAGMPWSRSAAGYMRGRLGTHAEASTVIGHRWTADSASAAFVNGVAGHAFELDDVHDETILHPGAVVIPAALAVAEETGASGREFLAAVVCGYEAMARVGLAVNPAPHMLHGFHPTASCGPFGAAAAAARLMELDHAGMVNALGLAASFAGGIMEFSRSGGTVKRLHAGQAAESGVKAAGLAAAGLAGPARGLDGDFGFCRVFSPDPQIHRLDEGLGERFMIDEITIKPYACCSDVHPIIDALLTIRERDGPDPDRIIAIRLAGPRKMAEQNSLDGTTSIMAAQYSAEYTAALTLLRDIHDPDIYTDETLADDALARLQDKVTVVHEPAFDEKYAWLISGRAEVELDSGKTLTETVHGARGSIHRTLTDDEVHAKFMTLTTARLGREQAVALSIAVDRLEKTPEVTSISAELS